MSEYSTPVTAAVQPGQATTSVRPVSSAERVKSIDVIRGFALLGILLMNIPGFGIHWSQIYEVLNGPRAGKDYYTAATIFTLFEGTMRGLFSMLFGAGMVLFMQNKKSLPGEAPVAEYYYRRLLWLVLFGLFNAFILLWTGDILFFYGFCGMILFAFRKLKAHWLIILGFVCIGINMMKTQNQYNDLRSTRLHYVAAIAAENAGQALSEKQQEAMAAWPEIEKGQKPDTASTNKHLRKMHSGYGTIFNFFIPQNVNGEVNYLYHGIWDMLSMMFIGMGLFMIGFFSNKLSASTYLMTLLIGYGIGIPLGWWYFNGFYNWTHSFAGTIDAFRAPVWEVYDYRRVFLCLGHASLLMLVFRSRIVPWLMKALGAVGQMAFTNYLTQSIICTLYFYGYGFDNYNRLRLHELYYVVFAVWAVQLIYSPIWLRYFQFGPFEWLWRSLTYWKLQPMRRKANDQQGAG